MTAHDSATLSREDILRATDRPAGGMARTLALAATVIGILAFITGLVFDPDRAWRAYHVNWLFFTVICSAAVMFVAVQRITTARWSRPIIRFLEGYVAFLPVAFLLWLVSLFLSGDHIFSFRRTALHIHEKAVYLDPTFFAVRTVVILGLFVALSLWYIYTCVRLDVGIVPEAGARWAAGLRERMRRNFGDERRELHSTHSLQGRLAVFLALLFGYGWSILIFDTSMSLDLHFQSTLYGWWGFMTGWLGALTSWSLITMLWRRHLDTYDLITESHFHDLGKLCFAFTAFWGYLTFAQYLVIWYGNMAEEAHFMRLRFIAPWKPFTLLAVFLVFVLPFFGLLSRAAKVFLPTFVLFAVSSLVGTYLQRYLEVYPSLYGTTVTNAPFGLYELGITLGYIGIWGLCYLAFMNAFPRMRVLLMTSPYRDEVQVPVDPKTMEPLPAHE